MTEQTTGDITVAAEPPAIMAVIADFASYPAWATGVREATVVDPGADAQGRARRVRFVLDAAPIRDEYVLAYDWDDDRTVRWTLVEANLLRGMEGAYALTPQPDGTTQVTYRLTVDVSMPLIGTLRRKAERVVIDAALKGLKTRVESGAAWV